MKKVDIRKALNITTQYSTVIRTKVSKKNKNLWLRRGYSFEGAWKCFDYHRGSFIVRAWNRSDLGQYLLEVISYSDTEWFIFKRNKWMRFRSKCEAERY